MAFLKNINKGVFRSPAVMELELLECWIGIDHWGHGVAQILLLL